MSATSPVTLTVVLPESIPPTPPNDRWFAKDQTGRLQFHGHSFQDHVDAWTDAQSAVDAGLWGQAMVAASLEGKYGDKAVAEFAQSVNRSRQWIYDMARAYRTFELSSQLDNLSFTHHVEAAKASDPADALAKAAENNWNTKETQNYAETGIEPEIKPKNKPAKEVDPPKFQEKAIQDELTRRLESLREWPTQATTPLLARVYQRCLALLEWQKNRTTERDCHAIMEVFSDDEGTTAPDCASFAYIHAWLNRRGWMMTKRELSERIETMKTLKMLTDYSRKASKGDIQRGAVPPVYSPCEDYLTEIQPFEESSSVDRRIALHLDWVARTKKHAPEMRAAA